MYKGKIEHPGATVPFPIIPGHENVGVIAEIGDRAAETMEVEGEKLEVGIEWSFHVMYVARNAIGLSKSMVTDIVKMCVGLTGVESESPMA